MIVTHLEATGTMAIIFLLIEWILFMGALMFMVETAWPPSDRPPKLIPPEGPFPLTDIFICCCKEPVDVIVDTVKAALHQVYPADRYALPSLGCHMETMTLGGMSEMTPT